MAATALGKYLRRLRIDNDELLKTMADKLGIASSTLSSIETGRRNPPKEFAGRLAATYNLDPDELSALQDALDRSRDEVSLRIKEFPGQDQQLAVAFARKFACLSEEQKKRLRGILEED